MINLEYIKKIAFINELQKIASGEYSTPSKWKGIGGYHRAVAENSEKHNKDKVKSMLAGAGVASVPVLGFAVREMKNMANEFNAKMPAKATDRQFEAIKSKFSKQVSKRIKGKFGTPLSLALFGGGLIGSRLAENKYLSDRGIKKPIVGSYQFSPEAQKKYL